MSPAVLADRITEDDAVRRWRCEVLQRAGYPPSDAVALSARRDIDLHRAVELLRQGCPVEIAMRILL